MVYKQSRQYVGSVGFGEKIDNAIMEVQTAIQEHQNGQVSFSNVKQLEKILHELATMKEVKSSKDFSPAFPRIIVDSWDYSNELGIYLLELFEIYKKVK